MSKNPRGKSPLTSVRGADRTRTILIQVGVGVVLVALIVAIGISIAAKRSAKNDPGPTPSVAAAPASPDGVSGSITDKGAIRIGKPNAKTTVRVVADLQCPSCKMFEQANGKTIEDGVQSGDVAVEYNIIAFLDKMSGGTQYSSRGANAAYCLAESDPTKFLSWLSSMYEQQPQENSGGLSDDQIVQIAQAAGYTDPGVGQCITGNKYGKYVQKNTQDVLGEGIQSTPSIFVNGKPVTDSKTLMQPDGLRQAIESAK